MLITFKEFIKRHLTNIPPHRMAHAAFSVLDTSTFKVLIAHSLELGQVQADAARNQLSS